MKFTFKGKNILLIAMLAVAGLFGATSAVVSQKINEEPVVEKAGAATPSSYTKVYRFTVSHDFGSDVGNHIYLHAWGSSGGDTEWGKFITLSDYSYNENSERVYTYATNYTYTGFQIIQYYDNPTYHRSSDIVVGSNTAWSWSPGGDYSQTAASPWTPTNQTYYLYDYRNLFGGNAKCYAWQSNGSLNNGSYPGVAMTAVQYGSGQLYSITLDPAFDEFKLGIGDSSNTGDLWINQHRGACYCFWETNPGWSTDLDWVKAHDWALNTMHIRDIPTSNNDDTGACRGSGGYYQKAKTAYDNFSSSVKAKFADITEYGDAQTRFVAWAKSNGKTASFSGTTLTVNAIRDFSPLRTLGDESNISTVIIIAASSVALLSVAALSVLVIKKKKNKEE